MVLVNWNKNISCIAFFFILSETYLLLYVINFLQDHKKRLNQWILRSFCLLMLGLALNLFGIFLDSYSSSFTSFVVLIHCKIKIP